MIYEFASDLSGELQTIGPLQINGVAGTVEAVSVFGDLAAIMFVDFNRSEFDTHGHKIVVLNWRTRAATQIDPDLPLVSYQITPPAFLKQATGL